MKIICLTLLFFALIIEVISSRDLQNSSSNLVSDGSTTDNVQATLVQTLHLDVVLGGTNSTDCELLYNLLPCSYTILGKLFLILAYGFLYIIGESFVVAGGELIFEVNGTIGANLFHVISVIPDAIILLVSGFTVSTETAQSKVSIGIGLLVGSTVFYITAVWGFCVYAGKCDLEGKESKDTKDTKSTFSLLGSGVSTEIWTTYAARIMVISIIPFVVTQIPQILRLSSGGQDSAILIALILSVILTISYFFYEFYRQPLMQKRRIEFVEHKQVMSGILIYLDSFAPGELLTTNGEPNREVLEKLFEDIDENKDGFVSHDEVTELINRIQSEATGLNTICRAESIMQDFDISGDKQINFEEFIEGISKWLHKAKRSGNAFHDPGLRSTMTMKYYSFNGLQKGIQQEHYMLVSDRNNREEGVKFPKWTSFKAAMMLLLGTSIVAFVAEPLVDAVAEFSEATTIPTFFVSFIALPLATSFSETLSAIKMARQKTQRTVSSTLSELSVMVTLNNLLCLSVFLAIVYIKGLTWDFSFEVLTLAIVCIVMGGLTSFRTILPLWTSLVAILLYPSSLALVYVLHSVAGWS